MTTRPRYTDEQRAEAVAMLTVNGYPDNEGALTHTARQLNIPAMTISRWFKGTSNPPPHEVVNGKKADLSDMFESELYAVFDAMKLKRSDASYQQLATAAGIYTDKMRLLRNLPTEIVQVLPDVMGALQAMGQTPSSFFDRLVERAVNEYGYRRASG